MLTRLESLRELKTVDNALYNLTYWTYQKETEEVERITQLIAQISDKAEKKRLMRTRLEFKVLAYQDLKVMNHILKLELGLDLTKL